MTPTKHPLCNDILRAPIGDPNCDDLPIRREDTAVWSFWQPNAEELAALVMGGTVALHVCGQTHPPLSIHATTPTEETTKLCTPPESAVIDDAIRGRYAALISLTKRMVTALCRDTPETVERRRLVDSFLDMIAANQGKGEVVTVPAVEVEATTPSVDQEIKRLTELKDAYLGDALEWKVEAERFEAKLILIGAALGDEWNVMPFDAAIAAMKARLASAEQRAGRLQAAIDAVIDQLNRASVENPNPAES